MCTWALLKRVITVTDPDALSRECMTHVTVATLGLDLPLSLTIIWSSS